MTQKLILARTLMEDSDLILMDEPFGALDASQMSQNDTKMIKNGGPSTPKCPPEHYLNKSLNRLFIDPGV